MTDIASAASEVGDLSFGAVTRPLPNTTIRDTAQLLRDMLVELRVMNYVLAESLNSSVDLEAMRRELSL